MRLILVVSILILAAHMGVAQDQYSPVQGSNKGKFYFYWGWNRGWYSKSDIKFSGTNYDFVLKKVVAKDRQTEVGIDPYINPARMTIPQYNFRLGYFIKDNWNVSFGVDHMKYVVQANQTVRISGDIDSSQTKYDGHYSDDDIIIASNFLQFEHTDGLNYVNLELRRFDNIFDFDQIKINLTAGAGIGGLYPKTNTTLLNKERYDEFHLSGFGLDIMAGINVSFFEIFFIQSEFKGGYINMPGIRTTASESDKASQSFFFSQLNIVFGGIIHIGGRKKTDNM